MVLVGRHTGDDRAMDQRCSLAIGTLVTPHHYGEAMSRTFVFDDGQLWHIELTRLAHQSGQAVTIGARFWADATPEQRVVGRISPRGLALTDAQLADALREALRHLAHAAMSDA